MKIEKVEYLPEKACRKNKYKTWREVTRILDTCMDARTKYGKITFDANEYNTNASAREVLNQAAKKRCYPLRFKVRNYELYFIRTDM